MKKIILELENYLKFLGNKIIWKESEIMFIIGILAIVVIVIIVLIVMKVARSEEHTSELQSQR